MVIKDINYVAYLSVAKGIDFDTYNRDIIDGGRRTITAFVYEDLTQDDYHRAVADYHKSNISDFVSKLRTLKTIVHDTGGDVYGKENTGSST